MPAFCSMSHSHIILFHLFSQGGKGRHIKRPEKRSIIPCSTISIRSIMGAVLLTAGPVASFRMVQKNRRRMRSLKEDDFLAALNQLQTDGFGRMVQFNVGSSKTKVRQVFVKLRPSEIEESLMLNPDLCTPADYHERYSLPSPQMYICRGDQISLVNQGLVPKESFMGGLD